MQKQQSSDNLSPSLLPTLLGREQELQEGQQLLLKPRCASADTNRCWRCGQDTPGPGNRGEG
jgi:hypothetical protein